MAGIRRKPESATRKRVLLVDDHAMVRDGIRTLVAAQDDLEICGEAGSAAEAMGQVERTRPDLAVVDLSLGSSSGLELIKEMQSRCPAVPILVLSARGEGLYAERALRAGARGYVTKDEQPDRLLDGMRKVAAGGVYVSDSVAGSVMSRILPGKAGAPSPVDALTDRELAVFELIGSGLGSREIAEHLAVSLKTVESHREHIKAKLGLDCAPELLRRAIQWVQYQKEARERAS